VHTTPDVLSWSVHTPFKLKTCHRLRSFKTPQLGLSVQARAAGALRKWIARPSHAEQLRFVAIDCDLSQWTFQVPRDTFFAWHRGFSLGTADGCHDKLACWHEN
jgi:hypothetical protein